MALRQGRVGRCAGARRCRSGGGRILLVRPPSAGRRSFASGKWMGPQSGLCARPAFEDSPTPPKKYHRGTNQTAQCNKPDTTIRQPIAPRRLANRRIENRYHCVPAVRGAKFASRGFAARRAQSSESILLISIAADFQIVDELAASAPVRITARILSISTEWMNGFLIKGKRFRPCRSMTSSL